MIDSQEVLGGVVTLVGVALLLWLSYQLGRDSGEGERLDRLAKALGEWRPGDPGFWHTAAVMDVMISGRVDAETRIYREKEREQAGRMPHDATFLAGEEP